MIHVIPCDNVSLCILHSAFNWGIFRRSLPSNEALWYTLAHVLRTALCKIIVDTMFSFESFPEALQVEFRRCCYDLTALGMKYIVLDFSGRKRPATRRSILLNY